MPIKPAFKRRRFAAERPKPKVTVEEHTQAVTMPKLGTDKVLVLVGPKDGAKSFTLHVDLVKLHSKYIANEVERLERHTESDGQNERSVRLISHSVEDFEIFRAFMYTGHVYSVQPNELGPEEFEMLGRIWALGKSLQSTTFKDAITDAIMSRGFTLNMHSSLHVTMATHFHESSGLRKFMVDSAASVWGEASIANLPLNSECLHFYKQLIIRLKEISSGKIKSSSIHSEVNRKTNCSYHEHESSERCYKKICPTSTDDVRHKTSEMPSIDTLMLEVHVGEDGSAENFLVHAELATRHSKFIATAMGPEWKEGKERILPLPKVLPETFRSFYDFINTSNLQFTISDDQEEKDWNHIAETWLFGDYLKSTSFQDAVVDAMLALMRRTSKFPTTMYQKVYGNSIFPSGMRRLLADVAVFGWFPDTLSHQPSDPKYVDFFRDVAVLQREQIELGAPYDWGDVGCHYHDHGSDELCYSQQRSQGQEAR